MGLSNLMADIAANGVAGMTLGGTDMSILSEIAPPDTEDRLKYEAMGLPDPTAFAALTALGAIPNPMAMLNAMMLKAEKKIEAEASASTQSVSQEVEAARPSEARNGTNAETASSATSDEQLIRPQPRSAPVKFKLPGMAEGKSFVEAFQELEKAQEAKHDVKIEEEHKPAVSGYLAAAQRMLASQEEQSKILASQEVTKMESRVARHAKEAAEQAKIAAERARDGISLVADSKGVAQVFSSTAEDDAAMEPSRPLQGMTLSSLLTGTQSSPDGTGNFLGSPIVDKICISRLPKGITDSAVRLECARHGAVTSVILQGDGTAAYVSYATAEMANNAMRRILGRTGVLGSTEPLDVQVCSEVPEGVRLAPASLVPETVQEPVDPAELPEYLRPKKDGKKERSRSRSKKRSRSRRKRRSKSRKSRSRKRKRRSRKRSKSRDRWLDRSRSNSHTATGQYIRATGCTSTVRPWEKKRENSSSSSRSRPRTTPAADDKRPRQVAIKGNWAQFMQKGATYYYNLVTGQTIWDRPKDFDATPSRRAWEGGTPQAPTQVVQTGKSMTGCLL